MVAVSTEIVERGLFGRHSSYGQSATDFGHFTQLGRTPNRSNVTDAGTAMADGQETATAVRPKRLGLPELLADERVGLFDKRFFGALRHGRTGRDVVAAAVAADCL